MATPEEVVEQLGAKIARQAARITELEKKLAAKKAECEELEGERDEYRRCAVRHKYGRMDFICQMWTQVDRYEKDRSELLSERDTLKIRCEALKACRQCRYTGAACKDCPNDAALRAVEG